MRLIDAVSFMRLMALLIWELLSFPNVLGVTFAALFMDQATSGLLCPIHANRARKEKKNSKDASKGTI